jgi:Family of unknown function (DUF5908)
MPVQINELIIRAHVKEPEDIPKSSHAPAAEQEAREEIIRECLERILELLHHQNER